MENYTQYVTQLGSNARRAAQALTLVKGSAKTEALRNMSRHLISGKEALLAANALDVQAAQGAGLAPALIERLKLTDKRISAMAESVEQIARQTDPVGQTLEGYVRPNGLKIAKVRVPIGVILFFYESRPNVTSDAAALCLKSGNAVILRGGKESLHSNRAIGHIISQSLAASGLDAATVQLIESTDRALVPPLLKLDKYIDLVIPRGGESLIRAVVADSTIPVLKHYTGNCHIYVDRDIAGREQQVVDICVNAKTSYPGGAVCNAVEKILVHAEVAARMVPRIARALAEKGVALRGDEGSRALYGDMAPATADDWPLEYLALTLAMKVVENVEEAITHINEFGSHHTDAILSNSIQAIERFTTAVDSASVMVNTTTRFADGGEYGLGAEIGISTDKLHARGPMGAMDLTTYKWVVTGDGQVR